jgi:hypothetical protein
MHTGGKATNEKGTLEGILLIFQRKKILTFFLFESVLLIKFNSM